MNLNIHIYSFVRVWEIPEGGLVTPTNEPVFKFPAHAEKIQIIKFHPFAKDIILTSASDRSVKIWDLTNNAEPAFELEVRQMNRIMYFRQQFNILNNVNVNITDCQYARISF